MTGKKGSYLWSRTLEEQREAPARNHIGSEIPALRLADPAVVESRVPGSRGGAGQGSPRAGCCVPAAAKGR